MPPVNEVRLLGPIEVVIDGASPPPELLWRKHLGVALLLWSERPRPVSRDRLLGMLWADRPEASARHSLNEALRVIRRSFGAEAVRSTPDAVAWVAEIACDTDRFRETAEDDPIAAVKLVRGPWCQGLVVAECPAFEAWCDAERDRWRGPLAIALARASGILLDRGDVHAALELAERAHAVHAWGEQGVLAVMRARALAGDRAGAMAAGREHVRTLADDLGAEPSVAVTRTLSALQDDVKGTSTTVESATGVRPDRPPFLERGGVLHDALDVLRGALQQSAGATVLCLGPTGSGRSRLLAEIADRLRLTGAGVVGVRAVPGDALTSHGGLEAIADALLRGPAAVAGATPEAIGTLSALRPAWAERFPGASTDRSLPIEAALLAVLRAAADEAPLVIVIDDIDRFTPAAVAAIGVVMRELADRPVAWVVSAETAAHHAGVDALGRLIGDALAGTTLLLPPLDPRIATALAAWAVDEWEPDARERLVRRLLVESAGSLFIAVELLTAVRAGFGLPEAQAPWPAADRTLDDTLPAGTPTTLTLALRHAFGLLDLPAQQLLQQLAVGPEPCAAGVLADVPEVLLDRLERGRWLVSDARGYQIAARSVRRFIAQETLTPGQRRRLTERQGPGGVESTG